MSIEVITTLLTQILNRLKDFVDQNNNIKDDINKIKDNIKDDK